MTNVVDVGPDGNFTQMDFGPLLVTIESSLYYVETAMVIVTLPFYVIVVIVLLLDVRRNVNTSGPFYRIYMIGGIVDIVAIVNMYLLSILTSRGYFIEFMLSTILVGQTNIAIAWGVRYAQGMTAIILSLNRLTAVVFPIKFKQLWSSRNIAVANLVQVVPGTVMGAGTFTGTFAYKKNVLGGIYCFINDSGSRSVYYLLAGFVQTVFIFYLIFNYVIVFRSFRRQLGQLSTWLFSLWALVIWVKIPSRLFHMLFDFLSSLYACTPPYLLFLFSTPFQKRIRAFLGYPNLLWTQSISSTSTSSLQSSTPRNRLSWFWNSTRNANRGQ